MFSLLLLFTLLSVSPCSATKDDAVIFAAATARDRPGVGQPELTEYSSHRGWDDDDQLVDALDSASAEPLPSPPTAAPPPQSTARVPTPPNRRARAPPPARRDEAEVDDEDKEEPSSGSGAKVSQLAGLLSRGKLFEEGHGHADHGPVVRHGGMDDDDDAGVGEVLQAASEQSLSPVRVIKARVPGDGAHRTTKAPPPPKMSAPVPSPTLDPTRAAALAKLEAKLDSHAPLPAGVTEEVLRDAIEKLRGPPPTPAAAADGEEVALGLTGGEELSGPLRKPSKAGKAGETSVRVPTPAPRTKLDGDLATTVASILHAYAGDEHVVDGARPTTTHRRGGRSGHGPPPPPKPTMGAGASRQAMLDKHFAQVLAACWLPPSRSLAPFFNDTCHMGWQVALRAGRIISVGAGRAGVPGTFTVGFGGGLHLTANVASCDDVEARHSSSFKGAVLAHFVDRLTRLSRTPAVVFREIHWEELYNTGHDYKRIIKEVRKAYDKCTGPEQRLARQQAVFAAVADRSDDSQSGDSEGESDDDGASSSALQLPPIHAAITGVPGYTVRPVASLPKHLNATPVWTAKAPSRDHLEFVRLALTLVLTAATVREPPAVGWLDDSANVRPEPVPRLVSLHNLGSDWTKAASCAPPADLRVCNRSSKRSTFTCNIDALDESHPPLSRHAYLEALVCQACVFPSDVGTRLLALARAGSSGGTSLGHMLRENVPRADIVADSTIFSLTAVNELTERVGGCVQRCIDHYGKAAVLFDDK